MKSNIHKKLTFEDKFARKFWCENARKNELKQNKKAQKKRFRKIDLTFDSENGIIEV